MDRLRIQEPFEPKIVLTYVIGIAKINLTTGIPDSTTAPCIVCSSELERGLAVEVSNGLDDKIHVGYCCCGHQKIEIIQKAFETLYRLLRKRLAQIEEIDVDSITVVKK